MQKPVVKQKKLSALSLSKHDIDTVPKVNTKQNAEMSFRSISSNTSNDGNRTISQLDATDNDGKNYRIKRVDNKITELSVNGTIIPQSQYGDYDEVIRQIDESQRLRVAKQKQDIAVRRAIVQQEREKRKQLSIVKQKELSQKIELRKETQIQNKLKRGQERKLLEQKNELQKAAYRQKKAALMQNEILYNQKKIEMMQHKNLYNKKMAEVTRKQNLLKQSLKNDDIKTIIADLNNQDLVTDSDDLTFSLDDKELVVNGKKQPSEIHRQFKEKYIHNNNDRFIYSKKGNQTSITINKE